MSDRFSWKSFFRKTIGTYFINIIAFIVNIVLVFIATGVLDFYIIIKPHIGILHVIIIAIINVGLLISIYFSFLQLHRFLVAKTISIAGDTILSHYISPIIDKAIAKLSPSIFENQQTELQLRNNLLQSVRQEHGNRSLKLVIEFIFRKINLKNIDWLSNRKSLSLLLRTRSSHILSNFVLSSKYYLYFVFGLNWIFVLVLILFSLFLK